MKVLYIALVAAALAACASADEIDRAGNALPDGSGEDIPTIPGDNSHYVEGESRYIWVPDGEGQPHLVDLKKPVNDTTFQAVIMDGAQNQYWLFTRENPHQKQILVYGDKSSITKSNYRASRPTKVIAHGWRSSGTSPLNIEIAAAFLVSEDCNVIVVDWSKVAGGFDYPDASAGVPNVGDYVGNFLVWLFNIVGGDWNTLHLTGHSLGAHVVGNAGRAAGGRPRRVTGMDPAGPLWTDNNKALDKRAGRYVEAIHTDGGLLGLYKQLGHADFYPNGGQNPQPGCWISTCSHSRAYELFAATVQQNHLVGRACASVEEARAKKCSGAEFRMGNDDINKSGSGIYGLPTGSKWPY